MFVIEMLTTDLVQHNVITSEEGFLGFSPNYRYIFPNGIKKLTRDWNRDMVLKFRHSTFTLQIENKVRNKRGKNLATMNIEFGL